MSGSSESGPGAYGLDSANTELPVPISWNITSLPGHEDRRAISYASEPPEPREVSWSRAACDSRASIISTFDPGKTDRNMRAQSPWKAPMSMHVRGRKPRSLRVANDP